MFKKKLMHRPIKAHQNQSFISLIHFLKNKHKLLGSKVCPNSSSETEFMMPCLTGSAYIFVKH